jgi:hypothetical protein
MKRFFIVLSVVTAGLMAAADVRSGTELVRFGEILGGVAREFSANPAGVPVLGLTPRLLRALPETDRMRHVPVVREVLLYLRNNGAISPSSAAAYLMPLPRSSVVVMARDFGQLDEPSEGEDTNKLPRSTADLPASIVDAREIGAQLAAASSQAGERGVVGFNILHLERALAPYGELGRRGFVPRMDVRLDPETERKLERTLTLLRERAKALGISDNRVWEPTLAGEDDDLLIPATWRRYEAAHLRGVLENLRNFLVHAMEGVSR